jgi:hypothetical protein
MDGLWQRLGVLPLGQIINLRTAAGRGEEERGEPELGVGGDLRAVRQARVRPRRVRQFLDIGSGIPTVGDATHRAG